MLLALCSCLLSGCIFFTDCGANDYKLDIRVIDSSHNKDIDSNLINITWETVQDPQIRGVVNNVENSRFILEGVPNDVEDVYIKISNEEYKDFVFEVQFRKTFDCDIREYPGCYLIHLAPKDSMDESVLMRPLPGEKLTSDEQVQEVCYPK